MKQEFKYLRAQWHGQPKILSGSKCLILGEQQYFDGLFGKQLAFNTENFENRKCESKPTLPMKASSILLSKTHGTLTSYISLSSVR